MPSSSCSSSISAPRSLPAGAAAGNGKVGIRGAALVTAAIAARTAGADGDLVPGYRLSFLIAAGLGVLGAALVALVRSPAPRRAAADAPAAASPEEPADLR